MHASLIPTVDSIHCPPSQGQPKSRSRLAQLRREVLRLGDFLGWEPAEVRWFVEDLNETPWANCNGEQLEAAANEFNALAEVIAVKGRRQARRLAGSRAGSEAAQ